MFKKIIIMAILLAPLAPPLYAQPIHITIPCDPQAKVYNLMVKYNNKLLMSGDGLLKSPSNQFIKGPAQVFYNHDSGTMAVVINFKNSQGPTMTSNHILASSRNIKKKQRNQRMVLTLNYK